MSTLICSFCCPWWEICVSCFQRTDGRTKLCFGSAIPGMDQLFASCANPIIISAPARQITQNPEARNAIPTSHLRTNLHGILSRIDFCVGASRTVHSQCGAPQQHPTPPSSRVRELCTHSAINSTWTGRFRA
jgi:hypothetical protein